MARPTRGDTTPEAKKPSDKPPTIHVGDQPVSRAIGTASTASR